MIKERTIYQRAEDLFDEVFKQIDTMGFNNDEINKFKLLQANIRFRTIYEMEVKNNDANRFTIK